MKLKAATAATAVCGLAAAALALPSAASADSPSHNATKGDVRNVIYLLGDGMGRTHVTAGRERFYGATGRLQMERLPVVGQVATYAVEKSSSTPSLVTDSAASATAWSTGVKSYNGAISVDAYGRRVSTLMEQAKAAGMRTGNVSTAEVTDATPAAMYSHALLRGCQGPVYTAAACLPPGDPTPSDTTLVTPIAEQIARNGTADVVLGGGLSRFEPDDQQALQAQGYDVLGSFGDPAAATQTAATQRVATRADLARVHNGSRVVALFNRGNLTIERAKHLAPTGAAIKAEPSLAELTGTAIEALRTRRKGKGFLLQVEGALIDKRSHANDAAQTLDEVKAFDDAVKVARDFAERDGHTLVIATADHECAGFNIIERDTFTNAEATTPPLNVDSGNPANNSTPSRPTGGTLDPARSTGPVNGSGSTDPRNFAPATFRTPDDDPATKDGDPEASLWLTYLSGNHTGADVPLFAYGPQSARFARTQENTSLYTSMHDALRALGRG